MTITPAYGRDYKSAKAALADWEAGKDFIIADMSSRYDGSYMNREDSLPMDTKIMIRYNRLTKIVAAPLHTLCSMCRRHHRSDDRHACE